MNIVVEQITPNSLVNLAAAYTTRNPDKKLGTPLAAWIRSEHSVIRALWFAIHMRGIPAFVAGHFARHHVGCIPFVQSNRPDRGGDKQANRHTPVNMLLIANAQAIIDISRRRLCRKASEETRLAWEAVTDQMGAVCPDLAKHMVPNCIYRGKCHELTPCYPVVD